MVELFLGVVMTRHGEHGNRTDLPHQRRGAQASGRGVRDARHGSDRVSRGVGQNWRGPAAPGADRIASAQDHDPLSGEVVETQARRQERSYGRGVHRLDRPERIN